MQEFTVGSIVSNAISIGLRNAISVVGAVILWLLTFWIPYLNVGTTIGLLGMIAKMGRGEIVSPTEIFNPEYRKRMGEFFLVLIFVIMGTSIGYAFVLIPGIVIATAWSMAPLLVIDRGINPIEAINKSNELTYGHKWTIFGGSLVLTIVLIIASGIVTAIGGWIHELLGALLLIVVTVLFSTVLMGASAYVYATLSAPLDVSKSESVSE